MLSDEEREALEILKGFEPDDLQALEKITNLIKKQSKEIEELKEENKEIREWKYVIDNPIDLKKLSELDIIKIFGKSYIAKDLIEEINNEMLNEENSLELFYRKKYCKEVLQSLLDKED